MNRHLLVLLSLLSSVFGTPYVGFPFDQQLPTIARENVYYSFQLNNRTFESDTSDVSFEAENLPTWLSFDESTRTLSGTPTKNDTTDSLSITLVGTDDTGSISKNYTMIVSSDPGPELSSPDVMYSELATFGDTNGHDGLVLQSGQQFTLNFSKATFDIPDDSSSEIVAYYGRSSDRTSLPSWIKFNEETVSFYGTAPAVNSKIAPSFEFGFALIATDVAKYAGAIGTFNIVVGAHELSTNMSSPVILNGTESQSINYTIPFKDIYLDSEPISSSNISSYTLYDNPSWLSLDGETIKGTVPSKVDNDSSSFNFTLNDVYGNSVSILFEIDILTSLFTIDSIPTVNATRGEFFNYTLMKSMFTDFNETKITTTFEGDSTDWLTFHESNLTFNGQVPKNLQKLTVDLEASRSSSSLNKRSDDGDSISFEIKGVAQKHKSSSSSSHSSKSSSSSSHSSKTSSTKSSSSSSSSTKHSSSAVATTDLSTFNGSAKHKSNSKTLAIALGVAIPVVALIVLLIVLFFCCFKRRKNNKEESDSEKSPSSISGPILGNPLNNPNHNDTLTINSSDEDDSPKRLSTLNVLKLENKEYDDDSDGSSTTNVENDNRSIYQDALQTQSTDQLVSGQVPKRSWRRPTPRESVNSLNTIATDELFTVRAVDEENVKRQSAMSMFYPNQMRESDYFGSPNSSILTRDSSANFQRLDSDGNVVSLAAPYSDNRLGAKVTSNLDVLQEEAQHHDTTIDSSEYLSANGVSNSNSSNNVGSSSASTSIPDEFRPRETSNGDLKWDHINDSSTTEPRYNNSSTIQSQSSSRYNSTMTIQNHSNSTILAPQRQASTASTRARLVEFENQKKLYNFDPILDNGEGSDESESGEISFMV